jgi:hypothetical protein
MYNENRVDRSSKLKRRSTRHVSNSERIRHGWLFSRFADEYKEMNAVILLLPLILLVIPTIAHGQQATITAPPGSTINNATVTVFQSRFLSGTWNFVNGVGNVSGSSIQ